MAKRGSYSGGSTIIKVKPPNSRAKVAKPKVQDSTSQIENETLYALVFLASLLSN